MFKKIRMISIFFFCLMTVLSISVITANADSSLMSAHDIGAGAKLNYWSGSGGCNNVDGDWITLFQEFSSNGSFSSGWENADRRLTLFTSGSTTGVGWQTHADYGKFKYWTRNRSATSKHCNAGKINWNQ